MLEGIIRLLPLMGKPLALRHLHMGEVSFLAIESKGDFFFSFKEVTDPNLMEDHSVFRAFDAKIIQSSAEPVPHGFYCCRDFCGRPV